MIIKKEILEIVSKAISEYYPQVEYVILTGSQLEPEFVKPESDIDILLIGTCFSGITVQVINFHGYKIDFTRLGYNDLQRTIIDQFYNSQCVILSMIKKGYVIKDSLNLGDNLKAKWISLSSSGNLAFNRDLTNLRKALAKLKKHFSKELNEEYYLFMLFDFTQLISSIHLLLNDQGWYAYDGFRKVKILSQTENGEAFLKQIQALIYSSINDLSIQRKKIITYIDKYLNYPVLKKHNGAGINRLVVSINTQFDDINYFYADIISAIRKNLYLSYYFSFGFLNSYNYIFRSRFIILFDRDKDKFDEDKIIQELYVIFRSFTQDIQCSIVVQEYLNMQISDSNIYQSFETLFKELTLSINSFVKIKLRYIPENTIITSIVIADLLAMKLRFKTEVLCKVYHYLSIRWRPSEIFEDIDHQNIDKTNLQFLQDMETFYVSNKKLLKSVLEQRFCDYENAESLCFNLSNINKLCNIISGCITESQTSIDEFFLSLIGDIPKSEQKKAYYYIIFMDMLVDVMGINKNMRSKVAYALLRENDEYNLIKRDSL